MDLRVFNGATAIITGGASGIGLALARELARRGAEVVLADLQIELAEEKASEINASGGKASAMEIDVSDFSAVESAVNDTARRTNRLDFMFNNAGIAVGGEARHNSLEDWNRLLDVNLKGVTNGTHAAYQLMLKQGFGHIVNTASMAGLLIMPLSVIYSAAKFGIVGLSKSLRVEAAAQGIRVSVLCPGVIRTPLLSGGKYGRLRMDVSQEKILNMWDKIRPMAPEVFASKAINAVAKNQAVIIVPWWWKIPWLLDRLSPSLMASLSRLAFIHVQKKLKHQ